MSDDHGIPQGPPFAIGGLGGSGTRATAMLVRNCGCWLGGELNDALDNLWFTLLFKRASVLIDSEAQLGSLFDMFAKRMTGGDPFKAAGACDLTDLARRDRFTYTADWLQDRLESFVSPKEPQPSGQRWGWKEPNTHVVIERLFRLSADLKYVHVVRDPFYMAFSKNQNQAKIWGSTFLDRQLSGSASDALAYWVAVHRRIEALGDQYPGRVMFFSHDRFMTDPGPEAARLLDFLQINPPADTNQLFHEIVFRPSERPKTLLEAGQADTGDLAYCDRFIDRFI
ncbi:sulfotransferase [Hyphobacterium sp.]|uniref:sulfotransferase n=1 Tax=Hyphobacterium sp. TaxID=2004662 RepID=UPI003B51D3CE